LLGLCTVVLIYLLTRQWYGASAARWAAALMAFNEYYLTISSRATAHVPHLFLVTAAVYAFSRFLAAQRPVYLYMAGAAVGLAFYCKEHAALLLPVFLLALLLPRYRHWLRGPHAYLACALFVVVIGPDLLFNLVTDPGAARVTYGGQTRGQATYAAHLQRIGGIGFSPYPLMFYGRTAVMSVHQRITGSELRDETAEYQAMNPAIGMLLLGAALVTTFRAAGRDQFRTFLLFLLWGIFGFFTLIKRGNPPFRLDPVSWIWVEVTIVPAVILAGARLARATGMLRIAVWAFAGGALLYASAPSTVIAGGLREVEYAFGSASHTAQYVAAATVTAVRSHPLRALGIVAAAGAAAGLLLAFGRGWFGRGGQSQRRSEGVSPP
jgi:4-amino-4-deoxy-L-arabinose transferase-like glycosyltransferase